VAFLAAADVVLLFSFKTLLHLSRRSDAFNALLSVVKVAKKAQKATKKQERPSLR
jgi:hypothetical protein